MSRLTVSMLFLLAATLAATDDPGSPDPRYGYWAKAKPGSSATFDGEVTNTKGTEKLTMRQELESATKDAVTLSVTNTTTVDGKPKTQDPRHDVIRAGGGKVKWTKDPAPVTVTAAGKDYVCDVWSAKVVGDDKAHIKMYVNDAVPGGLVKLERDDPAVKVKFVLKEFEAKS